MDWCIYFAEKFNMAMTESDLDPKIRKMSIIKWLVTSELSMRAWSWNVTDSKKKLFSTWLFPDVLRYDSSKKCPTILYAVNLWLKPVSATGARVNPSNTVMYYYFIRLNMLHDNVIILKVCRWALSDKSVLNSLNSQGSFNIVTYTYILCSIRCILFKICHIVSKWCEGD